MSRADSITGSWRFFWLCRTGLTRLIRGASRGVDDRMRLSGRVKLCQRSEIRLIHVAVHHIAFKGDHKIHVAGWVGQSAFPKAIGVCWPLPCTMIFIIHHLTQRYARFLHDADVLSEV